MELPSLFSNSIIRGKWNENEYRIIKKVGEGGIGTVYKVINMKDKKIYALKLSHDNISLNREYGLLRELKDIDVIVEAYEIDDVDIGNKGYHFIAMEYIRGMTLNEYRKNKRITSTSILYTICNLLKFMIVLHEKGYVLGDAKLDNIIVNSYGRVIKFIDLGGVVKMGNAIKEFTPAYDRASWKCGARIAEDSYDLFSAIMILVQLMLEIELNPRMQTVDKIKQELDTKLINSIFKKSIIEILDGEKKNVKDFANTLLTLYNEDKANKEQIWNRKIGYCINLFFWGSLSLFCTAMWLVFSR